METSMGLVIGLYLLGAAAGVVVPFARKWLEEGITFDWRKVMGKVIAALLGLALAPTFAETLESLGNLTLIFVFLSGLGATFVGYEAQKTPAAIQAARDGE